jgi:hypothetical protein
VLIVDVGRAVVETEVLGTDSVDIALEVNVVVALEADDASWMRKPLLGAMGPPLL